MPLGGVLIYIWLFHISFFRTYFASGLTLAGICTHLVSPKQHMSNSN